MPKQYSELPESQVSPDPQLEKRTRRRFSTEYKVRIVAEADACRHGELGELLRRERLYSSQIQQWRRELRDSGIDGLSKSRPGPKPTKSAEQKRIEQLEKEKAQLKRRLQVAEDCVDLQKKALSMLDQVRSGSVE